MIASVLQTATTKDPGTIYSYGILSVCFNPRYPRNVLFILLSAVKKHTHATHYLVNRGRYPLNIVRIILSPLALLSALNAFSQPKPPRLLSNRSVLAVIK